MKRLVSISTYVLALLWALPLFGITYMAFKDTKAEGFSLTFRNFVEAWNAAPFAQYYVNTIIIVIGVLIVQLITMTLAAYAFARMTLLLKELYFFSTLFKL